MKSIRKHGRVLAHRWFSHGEGWAYHPDLESSLPELIKALSPELQERKGLTPDKWRQFRLDVPGGTVFGIHRLDSKCPDQKAAGRAPSVLIGVLLGKGDRVDTGEIAEKLADLQPEAEGADQRMLLGGVRMTRKKSWRKWIVRGLLAAIPVFVLSVMVVHSQDDYERSQRSLRETMLELATQRAAENTKSSARVGDEGASWRRFCGVFCRPANLPNSSHPDALWLGSLLSMPAGLEGTKRWNPQWKDYIEIINQWAEERKVGASISVRSDADEVSHVLRAIVGSLDYQSWIRQRMVSEPAFRRTFCIGSVGVDRELRKHPLALSNSMASLASWQVEYAKPLYELMADWDVGEVVPGDVQQRPWFVIQAFCAFVNRERFQSKAGNSPYDQFVSRLPTTNVLHKADYDISSKRVVDNALTELVTAISGTRPSLRLDSASAAARLQDSLDYDAWLKDREAKLQQVMDVARNKKDDESAAAAAWRAREQLDALKDVARSGTSKEEEDIAAFVARFKRQKK